MQYLQKYPEFKENGISLLKNLHFIIKKINSHNINIHSKKKKSSTIPSIDISSGSKKFGPISNYPRLITWTSNDLCRNTSRK